MNTRKKYFAHYLQLIDQIFKDYQVKYKTDMDKQSVCFYCCYVILCKLILRLAVFMVFCKRLFKQLSLPLVYVMVCSPVVYVMVCPPLVYVMVCPPLVYVMVCPPLVYIMVCPPLLYVIVYEVKIIL